MSANNDYNSYYQERLEYWKEYYNNKRKQEQKDNLDKKARQEVLHANNDKAISFLKALNFLKDRFNDQLKRAIDETCKLNCLPLYSKTLNRIIWFDMEEEDKGAKAKTIYVATVDLKNIVKFEEDDIFAKYLEQKYWNDKGIETDEYYEIFMLDEYSRDDASVVLLHKDYDFYYYLYEKVIEFVLNVYAETEQEVEEEIEEVEEQEITLTPAEEEFVEHIREKVNETVRDDEYMKKTLVDIYDILDEYFKS